MARSKSTRPTDGELEILQILWSRGRATVRDVCQSIRERRPVGYTTALKLMQIMVEKGILSVDKGSRPHVFEPIQSRGSTQQQLVRDLLNRAFGGSPGSLVLQALASEKATPEELRKIRELIDRLEEEEA